eukprot:662457_1
MRQCLPMEFCWMLTPAMQQLRDEGAEAEEEEALIAKPECISSADMLTNATMSAYGILLDADSGDAAIAGRRCRGGECTYEWECNGHQVVTDDLDEILDWRANDPDDDDDCLELSWGFDEDDQARLHIESDECYDGRETQIICRAECIQEETLEPTNSPTGNPTPAPSMDLWPSRK